MKILTDRVHIYLKTREIAEKFMNEGEEMEIVINRTIIKARQYIQNNLDKKIIITNVPPHFLHNVIIDAINSCGITPSSAMKYLYLTQADGFTTILSEERIVYVPAEVADKLPSSELIKFDGDE